MHTQNMHQILNLSMMHMKNFQEIDTTGLVEKKVLFIYGLIKILKVENLK